MQQDGEIALKVRRDMPCGNYGYRDEKGRSLLLSDAIGICLPGIPACKMNTVELNFTACC